MGAPTSPRAANLTDLRERAALAPDALSDADCLALLIRRGCGRAAPGWAERLIASFGSLPELLAASPAALGRSAPPGLALELRLLHDLCRRITLAPLKARPALGSSRAVADHLRVVLSALRREQFRVLFLDGRHRLIADEPMGYGTVDRVVLYPREVIRRALELDAAGLVLAHNHPSGSCAPSAADIELTRQVVAAGRALGVAVHDHLLVAGRKVVSFRRSGLLP